MRGESKHTDSHLRCCHHWDRASQAPLTRRLAAAGKTVAVIERGAFGGTCVNTGCIPTKTLVARPYTAHIVRRAADFGVDIGGTVHVDMPWVKAVKLGAALMGTEWTRSSTGFWTSGTP